MNRKSKQGEAKIIHMDNKGSQLFHYAFRISIYFYIFKPSLSEELFRFLLRPFSCISTTENLEN